MYLKIYAKEDHFLIIATRSGLIKKLAYKNSAVLLKHLDEISISYYDKQK